MCNAQFYRHSWKIDDLPLSTEALRPDFIIVTKTWLNDFHDDCSFNIEGYQLVQYVATGHITLVVVLACGLVHNVKSRV